jgi:hypothetical protein
MTLIILSMTEVDKYKHELADKLAPLIKKEGLTDVTDWVEKNAKKDFEHSGVARSVAYILEATGDFQREELQDKSRFYVKRLPKRSLEQRYPTWFKFGLVLLGSIITIIGGVLQSQLKKQEPQPIYKLQDYRVDALYDSVTNIRTDLKAIQDSLGKR